MKMNVMVGFFELLLNKYKEGLNWESGFIWSICKIRKWINYRLYWCGLKSSYFFFERIRCERF